MALSKERKEAVVSQYQAWIKESKAMVFAEYTGMSMKDFDALRNDIREIGGEFHVVKNTLGKRAFEAEGLDIQDDMFLNSTAVGFAFDDVAGVAKAVVDLAKDNKAVKVKGGYLGEDLVNDDQIKSLASLPPLPVVRAQLLGAISAPASKLARTINEPGRSIAQVLKAYADAEA